MLKYVPIDAKICPHISIYVPIYFNFTKSEIEMYKNTLAPVTGYKGKIYHYILNKSECEPVLTKYNISPCTLYIKSQSGNI